MAKTDYKDQNPSSAPVKRKAAAIAIPAVVDALIRLLRPQNRQKNKKRFSYRLWPSFAIMAMLYKKG